MVEGGRRAGGGTWREEGRGRGEMLYVGDDDERERTRERGIDGAGKKRIAKGHDRAAP